MKLRIKGNSIRLRLTQSEVKAAGTDYLVEEQTSFGDGTLTYRLKGKEQSTPPSAHFSADCIEIRIAMSDLKDWAESQEVGIEHMQQVDNAAQALKILVEKDFACLAPREGEDDSDAFPHPGGSHC